MMKRTYSPKFKHGAIQPGLADGLIEMAISDQRNSREYDPAETGMITA